MAIAVHIRKQLKHFTLHIDFEMEGGCMGFLGASGCGKSMTLKCIAGIETPDEGRIVLNDRVLFDSEKKVNLSPQKRKVGYLFHQYALFPHMTVRQNVEAGLSGSGRTFSSGKEKNAFVERLLEQFHIPELADALPARLSGGQQQRVALARIIASDPDILLLDEPFAAMDSYLREQLLQEMKAMLGSAYPKDVLMVSHNRDEVYQLCPQMAVMRPGAIEIAGSTGELFRRPQTVGAARLTGCKNISRAKILGPHLLYATDWGVRLTVADTVTEDITHVGLRAHDFIAAKPAGHSEDRLEDIFTENGERNKEQPENVMKCTLERITEAPFEIYLILRNALEEKSREQNTPEEERLQPVWWKIPKKEWEAMRETVPEAICFPPEHIILLRSDGT